MKKIILGFLLGISSFLIPVVPVQAAENFTTTLHTTYTVSPSGQTQVKQVINLTNNTPTLYAKQYGLKISTPDIKNVTVTSNDQKLDPEVVTNSDQTTIGITFPDDLVGEGKTRKLEINYLSSTSSVISGQVLEVLVPSLGGTSSYSSYQVTLITPAKFGSPTRATPTSYTSHQDGNQIITDFTPNNGSSVTALFGQQQIFEARLRYSLNNTSTNPGIAQIALPPDTPFQKMSYQVLEPKPQTLESDVDGNWIATYQVEPQSQLTVYAVTKVLITLDAAPNFPQTPVRPSLTSSQQYWESNASSIMQAVAPLNTPHEIYSYVVKTLSYDFQNVGKDRERYGAVNALANPTQAVCQEFADLFVAMARAKNIPARRLTGYGYTQNPTLRPLSLQQDILHAWVEYYNQDTHQWDQVDPTWENTTRGVNYFDQFDLNHIVFAINGESSTLPYPAGSYKLENQNDKDVEVVFSPDFPEQKPNFAVSIQPNKMLGIALPGRQEIHLTNTTGQAWYHVSLEPQVTDPNLRLSYTDSEIPVILPYQTIVIPLGLYGPHISLKEKTTLQLHLSFIPDNRLTTTNKTNNGQNPTTLTLSSTPVEAGPSYLQTLLSPAGLIGLGIGSLVLTGLTGSLLVLGQRRSRPVRRKS